MSNNLPFKVVCINDKNRPIEIPSHKWVKLNEVYTVIKIGKSLDGKLGFVLQEIELGPDTFPYDLFSAYRFAYLSNKTDNELADEAVKELLKETLKPETV